MTSPHEPSSSPSAATPEAAAALPRAGNAAWSPETLGAALSYFIRRPSVAIMLTLLAAAVVARAIHGAPRPTWQDGAVVLAFLLFQPFQEWLIHVYILHWRPRRILGRSVDLTIARTHRAHHNDPWRLDKVFIPLPAVLASAAFNVALWLLVMPTRALADTALFSVAAIGLLYEWTHFLIHTSYVPRGALYRRVWRLHRLHHFKNEGFWFGVTNHLGDRVLGTLVDPKAVPTSPTARTLGFEPAP